MTPPAGTDSRADARRNRAAIADAALRVLAEQPGASMAQIAEASGLGRATLYRHFSTRADLVHAIQQQALASAGAKIAACDLDKHPPAVALELAIRALIGVGDRYRVLGRETTLDPSVLPKQQAVARPLLATVERGQRSGVLRSDIGPDWILATMANLLVLALREISAGRLDPEQAITMVTSTLLHGITTPTPRRRPRPG